MSSAPKLTTTSNAVAAALFVAGLLGGGAAIAAPDSNASVAGTSEFVAPISSAKQVRKQFQKWVVGECENEISCVVPVFTSDAKRRLEVKNVACYVEISPSKPIRSLYMIHTATKNGKVQFDLSVPEYNGNDAGSTTYSSNHITRFTGKPGVFAVGATTFDDVEEINLGCKVSGELIVKK